MKSVWVMMLFLHCALSEKFKVVGPGAPVVATAGFHVVLPCSVRRLEGQSSLSAVNMTIKWTRSDAVVHFYENNKDVNTGQIPHYTWRTALFKEELQNGNVSLRLSDVDLRDEGEYKCRVESRFWEDEVSLNLKVEAIGERPVISVESYDSNSEQFRLLCQSKGWFPEPDLQWLNSKGENQPAEDPEIQRHAGLFTVKRSFTVHKNHIDTFYCRATLGEHMKKEEIRPGVFYDLLPWSTGSKAGIWIGVISLIAIVAGIVFYICKERQRKEEEERWDRERPEKEELIRAMDALGRSEEEQRNDSSVEMSLLKPEEERRNASSVETGLLNDVRKVPLQDLRGKLKRMLESRSTALLRGKDLTEKSCAVLASALSSQNSKLTKLDLSENELQNSGVKKLCEGLKSPNCKLKTLSLISCSFTKESCADLASVLRLKNSTLRELDLSENTLWHFGVKKLSEGLKDPNCKLERLGLTDCRLTDGCDDLFKALASNPSHLKELNLNYNYFRGLVIKELNYLLKDQCCQLEKLELAGCNISDDDCPALVEALKSNPSHLKELNLDDNNLKDSGVKKISELLKDPRCKLEKLQLSYCRLTEESCADLASVLKAEKSPLTDLDLSYNILEDSGVKKLCDGLKSGNCKLENLSLKDCNITDEGCAALVTALKSNPSHLRELDLSSNGLGESGVKKLRELQNSPHCKLEKLKI